MCYRRQAQIAVKELDGIYHFAVAYTVDLLIFVFQFSWEGQICEFRNLAKIIIIALLMKNENLRILNFVKSQKSEKS